MTVAALLLVVGATAAAHAQTAQDRLWDAAIAGDTAAIRKAALDGAVIDSLDLRVSENGRRALNWAALGNHVDAVRLLIALKAPLEAMNLTGFTALHHAAEVNAAETARVLLAAGANPNSKNYSAETPADVALARGFTALATELEAAAARAKANQP